MLQCSCLLCSDSAVPSASPSCCLGSHFYRIAINIGAWNGKPRGRRVSRPLLAPLLASSLTFTRTSQPCRLSWAAPAWRALQGTCMEGMRGGQQPRAPHRSRSPLPPSPSAACCTCFSFSDLLTTLGSAWLCEAPPFGCLQPRSRSKRLGFSHWVSDLLPRMLGLRQQSELLGVVICAQVLWGHLGAHSLPCNPPLLLKSTCFIFNL